ncbi:putative LPS assembly protein LptD [Gabonibacter chumensis]|uniref:putative LPS assembly protein LptD n=1 Tax=Gabonibacter chumensis TaxID=2972474 RepID=UPI0025747DBA|nr:putative LPS assembly protein LptD [Gabonibacter chumensis]MCR9012978.1 putative LPS assembly protein LptD [Gabonibacter chumensis]
MAIALPIILSSNSFAAEYLFGESLWNMTADTTGQPGDSLRIVYDSIGNPVDTLRRDSTPEAEPLFDDLITYESADSVRFSIADKKVFFYKDALIKYIKTELKADYIDLDMEKKLAFASGVPDTAGTLIGKPHFKDGGQEFDSKELRYNFETRKGFVKEIITQEGEGYLQGKLTKKQSDSVYCVKNGWYTTCDEHDHPHFYFRMSKAKMIKDKKVFAGFTNLVLEDVPLPLFLPFAYFPITKKGTSGIIIPTYGEERMRGFNLRNGGYYFAISDYMDLTITGDIYTNGSWGVRLGSTYRKRYKFNGNFDFSTSKNYVSEKGMPDYQESSDWSVRWTHSQDGKANPYSTFSASVDMSSANQNYFNSTNINEIANQRKQSSISWSKKWPEKPFSLSGSFNHNQNSQDSSISVTLPNLSFRMSQIYPFRKKGKVGEMKWYDNIGISYSADLKNNIQTKEDKLFKSSFTRDWNNGFRHNIPLSLSFKLAKDITLTPSLNYNGYLNLKTIERVWVPDTTSSGGHFVQRDIPGVNYSHDYSASASIGYTPTIYGMFLFKPGSKVYAIRHVIRPSLSASYTPPISPLGNYTKTYTDGVTVTEYSIYEGMTYRPSTQTSKQAGSVSFSLDNNLEMKVRNDQDTTGEEQFRKIKLLESFRIQVSYNPFAEKFKFSTIGLSARTKLFNSRIDLNFTGTLDPYALDEKGNKLNKYHGGIGRLTNASLSTGINFSADNGKNKEEKNEMVGGYYEQYLDFDVPWSINIDYTFSYSKPVFKSTVTQMMGINGDFSLTPKWKISFTSGYNFATKEISASSFQITRDLHCWEMSFNCIPFGQHQSYNFQINVRSSMLKDLKLTKRASWYDL